MFRVAALLWVGAAEAATQAPQNRPTRGPSNTPTYWQSKRSSWQPDYIPGPPDAWGANGWLRQNPVSPTTTTNRGEFAEDIRSSPSEPQDITEYSCGNCWKRVYNEQTATWEKTLCNTGSGNGKWKVRDDSWLWDRSPSARAENVPNPDAETSQAQVMKLSDVKAVMGDDWNGMFCRSYLSKYKDGIAVGNGQVITQPWGRSSNAQGSAQQGKTCVRGITKAAIKEADDDARMHWYMFGTSPGKAGGRPETPGAWYSAAEDGDYGSAWGYASSYAVPKGEGSDDKKMFGTGRSGDVPSNWCRYAMRDMLCHIAFPQVLGDSRPCCEWSEANQRLDCDVSNSNGMTCGQPGVPNSPGCPGNATEGWMSRSQSTNQKCDKLGEGKIRAVDYTSCENIFLTCNRRQPSSEETKSSYTPPEYRTGQAGLMMSGMEDPLWGEDPNTHPGATPCIDGLVDGHSGVHGCQYPNNVKKWWMNLTEVSSWETRNPRWDQGKKMESESWCGMWTQGFGLSRAGSGIGHHSTSDNAAKKGWQNKRDLQETILPGGLVTHTLSEGNTHRVPSQFGQTPNIEPWGLAFFAPAPRREASLVSMVVAVVAAVVASF